MSGGSPRLDPGESLGSILAAALAAPGVDHERAQYLTAIELSHQLAPRFGVGEADVFDALSAVPENMLDLLRSPDGWSALASFIAADFGIAMNNYQPTKH